MKITARNPAAVLTIAAAAAAVVSFASAQNAPLATGTLPGATAPGSAPGTGPATTGRGRGRGRGGPDPMHMSPPARPDPLPAFYNPKLPVQKRVEDLVSRLTLEEKVSLMQMDSHAIPRLGIAPYGWWTEALHGIANGTATVFPEPIGLAATWDVNLHSAIAKVIGIEGRAKHVAALAQNDFSGGHGLNFWSPNVNLFRDPRWGRGQESYGEDPYLSGRFAIQFVKGIQGDDPVYFQGITTPKHFAVHSGPEPLRYRFDALVTDQDMYTTYLPQFEAAVREGHTHSVMSAYSSINGIPCSGSRRLLTDILRTQWGFDGFVVSDVDSVSDIYQLNSHHYVPTAVEASALAVHAGNDLNSGTTYGSGNGGPSNLAKAVAQGLVTEKDVDLDVGRIIEARIRMGEFDPPGYEGNPYNKITADMNDTEEHNALARQAADETMVLLKNANQTLPLKTSIGTIAVLGPNANTTSMQSGNYNGSSSLRHRVSILDGIRQAVGADHVITTTNLRVPIAGSVALAEPIKPDYLYTDASKTKHGLTVAYAANAEGLARPTHTEVSETGMLKMPDAASGIAFDPTLAFKMTGVLVPPATGDYQLGAKSRDAFRLLLDGNVVLDETQGGALRVASSTIHLEKDKAYNVVVEFTHSPASGGRGRGFGRGAPATGTAPAGSAPAGGPATGRGPAPALGTAPAASSPTAVVFAPGRGGGPGGRGRGGGPAFGSTPEAPGITATQPAESTADTLFQIAWTKPTADGSSANTAGQNLYGEASDLARKADAVVLVVGIDGSQEGEMHDRSAIELPAVQEGLVEVVTQAAGNKPVIVVCCSGSPVALNWANAHASAIIEAWYPGQRGDAIADVLFGKVNPAGRLAVTFYKATADLPTFTDYAMYNRTYRYDTRPVLYPFGFGLSYSTFAYSNLSAPAKAGTGDDVKVSFTVKNTGTIDGDEVVQCYLNRDLPPVDPKTVPTPDKMSDEQATLLATPRKALVGFARVPLKAGESKTVSFTITTQQLSLVVGKDGKREVRPEKLQLQVGGNSVIGPGTLTQPLTLEGAAKAPEYHFIAPVVK